MSVARGFSRHRALPRTGCPVQAALSFSSLPNNVTPLFPHHRPGNISLTVDTTLDLDVKVEGDASVFGEKATGTGQSEGSCTCGDGRRHQADRPVFASSPSLPILPLSAPHLPSPVRNTKDIMRPTVVAAAPQGKIDVKRANYMESSMAKSKFMADWRSHKA